jgi:nucleotide-binding universal stress UspA family protein
MKPSEKKKLLVAVDGSKRSVETIRYLVQVPSFCRMEIHLFNVYAGVPESYWDLEREPSAMNNISQLHAWEYQNKALIEKHMAKCRDILLAHDVHPDSIHINVKKRKKGVARDIIAESKKGYAAVLLRRRGMTKLQKLVMGSTAQKILNGLGDVPLVFAGRKPVNPRVLIAFDGSANAGRVVDFACDLLDPGYHRVTLVSVLRNFRPEDALNQESKTVKDIMQLPMDFLDLQLKEAAAMFTSCGFGHDAVETRIVSESSSRAGSIVEIAENEDFGTIIAGRKGHSKVRDFTVGRVSSKILQLGNQFSVWIVC